MSVRLSKAASIALRVWLTDRSLACASAARNSRIAVTFGLAPWYPARAVSARVTDSRVWPMSLAMHDQNPRMFASRARSPAVCAACRAATQYR
jgi:hypothetical protein